MSIAEKFEVISDVVYEKGKSDECKTFWDGYLPNKLTDMAYRFAGAGWNDDTFYPDRDIVTGIASANGMFSYSRITDIEGRLASLNVTLDTSKTQKANQMFYYCNQTKIIPVINLSGVLPNSTFSQMCYMCKKLHTVRKIIFPENMTTSNCYNQMFTGCESLVNIETEGPIVQTISFADSPLSVESMKSIISCLYDFTQFDASKINVYSLALSTECKTVLEAAGTTAEYNGVACTWTKLVEYKGWVLE